MITVLGNVCISMILWDDVSEPETELVVWSTAEMVHQKSEGELLKLNHSVFVGINCIKQYLKWNLCCDFHKILDYKEE